MESPHLEDHEESMIVSAACTDSIGRDNVQPINLTDVHEGAAGQTAQQGCVTQKVDRSTQIALHKDKRYLSNRSSITPTPAPVPVPASHCSTKYYKD